MTRATHHRRLRLHTFARAMLAPILAAIAVVAIQPAEAQPRFPELTGRIVDEARLLEPRDQAALERELAALEQKSTDQVVIYTARTLQGYDIADYGYRLGRAWGIGEKGKDNGVILIVAPRERQVRIEVGRGLEPQLTDAMSKLIIENAILPAFRRGDFSGGIAAGVRDIRDVLLGDAEAVRQRARSGAKRSPDVVSIVPLVFLGTFILMAFMMMWMQSHDTAQAQRAERTGGASRGRRPRRMRRDDDWGSVAGGWGGWGGGGYGGGGGGGGFGGGGGGFGGGGASGGW
jgi:uncharacterized protein